VVTLGGVTHLVEVYKKGGKHFCSRTHRSGPVYLERPDMSKFLKKNFFSKNVGFCLKNEKNLKPTNLEKKFFFFKIFPSPKGSLSEKELPNR